MNVDYMVDHSTGQLIEWATERPLLAPGKGYEEYRHRHCLGMCYGRVGDCPCDGCPVLGLDTRQVTFH